ncbi:MAG: tRNA glutamyl-Q(34) synthetase GluQRS [Methylococcales bacterium]|nr:tRNA glutamyl-Q(34) synthetase GluQRS [Methylococcales bacterium]
MISPSSYRGRFAPSPTGRLHLGSLYTAVASFLDARAHQVQWLLRIDDLDTPRNCLGAAADILKTLETFGLHWDENIIYQSQQQSLYQSALDELRQQQLIYPCLCSRKNLKNQPIYPQFCRNKTLDSTQKVAIRLKTTPEIRSFQDQLQGQLSANIATDYGDFIIKRKDTIIAYQVAVIIDDQQQNISHIVRGIDLFDSTPRQLYLQKIFGFPAPHYAHLPIIVNPAGAKLSKQSFAKAIEKQHPEKILFQILSLLKQQPPAELKEASVIELLTWGVLNWNLEALTNLKTMTDPS